MKKYARTKEGKIVKINLEGDVFTSKYEIIGEPKDTIDELLDCLVFTFVFTEKSIYNGQEHKHIMYKPFVIEEDNIFRTTVDIKGATWTDKGLIYVAKMNEKGELELI